MWPQLRVRGHGIDSVLDVDSVVVHAVEVGEAESMAPFLLHVCVGYHNFYVWWDDRRSPVHGSKASPAAVLEFVCWVVLIAQSRKGPLTISFSDFFLYLCSKHANRILAAAGLWNLGAPPSRAAVAKHALRFYF